MRVLVKASVVAVALILSACGEKPDSAAPGAQPAAPASAGQAVTTAPAAPSTASAPQLPAGACNLVMGWDAWEPYQYKDADGSMKGLDVEVVQTLAGKLGCSLSFKEDSWVNLLQGMKDGSVQILAGASQSSERSQFAWFTDAYRNERFALFVPAEKAAAAQGKGLEGLLKTGFKVGVTEGYVYGPEVESLRDKPEYEALFVAASLAEANYSALLDHRIDGVLDDPIAAARYLRRRGLTEQVVTQGTEYVTGDVYLMLSKKGIDEARAQQINGALRDMVQLGSLNAIFSRY